jgi:uncharacterized protein YifN (PemK superfamily)
MRFTILLYDHFVCYYYNNIRPYYICTILVIILCGYYNTSLVIVLPPGSFYDIFNETSI